MSGKSKPTPGHKFGGALISFIPRCECGWSGAMHLGKGSRGQAVGEWRQHIESCVRKGPIAPPVEWRQ